MRLVTSKKNYRALDIIRLLLLLLIALYSQLSPNLMAVQDDSGKITGLLIDSESSEPIIGASVMVEGTKIGAVSDIHGRFAIGKVTPGVYTLVVNMIGYSRLTVKGIDIKPEKSITLELKLAPEAIQLKDVVVEAKSLTDNEAALLKQRQKSYAISDAISAEAISRSGSGNAAEAMMMVTGASVVGGKYVHIRGVGDRYSNTLLNGAELPSADPDKRAFNFDLLPGNFLDNIITVKSFTPDKPGDFAGGLIDIGTRNFPDAFTIKVTNSYTYNRGTTNNRGFLSYKGSSTDWLGWDNGIRDIPEVLQSDEARIPDIGTAYRDTSAAYTLQAFSRAFNPIMSPSPKKAPADKSFSLSLGDQLNFFNMPLGIITCISYERGYSFYDNGKVERWFLPGNANRTDSLSNFYRLSDKQGSDQVLWGALAVTSLKINPRHEVSATYLRTQSGESVARYLTGSLPENLADAVFETRVLKYTERDVHSFQLRGQHNLDLLSDILLEWSAATITNGQEEPDLRFFSNHYYVDDYGEYSDTTYSIVSYGGYKLPQRLFRDMSELSRTYELKTAIPFKQWFGLPGKVKIGYFLNTKKRTHRERVFEYHNRNYNYSYDGNPEQYFAEPYVGIVDSTGGRYTFANYIVDASEKRSNYDGKQTLQATFLMVEMPVLRNLRYMGGFRVENTKMDVVTLDPAQKQGKLRNNDWLVSSAMTYQVGQNTNLRAGYGRTLARPTFRELAPYPSYEFAADYFFIGNAELKRTIIDNYDLRLERFYRPGELFAISLFMKNFKNPIERAILSQNSEIQYQNVKKGFLRGLEVEGRLGLDRVHSAFRHFQLGGNFTKIKSWVNIPEDEMAGIRAADSSASDKRPLWGQASYVFNLDLSFDYPELGSSLYINYNVKGKMLSDISLGATPDIYEQPMPLLNVQAKQRLVYGIEMKIGMKNVLDSKFRKTYGYKGHEYIHYENRKGRSFSFGLTYNL